MAHLQNVKVALVGLPKGMLAAGQAVEQYQAKGEDVHAFALPHVAPAAAHQLLWSLHSITYLLCCLFVSAQASCMVKVPPSSVRHDPDCHG